jgi:two-component system sensor histidine kinase/response regulator
MRLARSFGGVLLPLWLALVLAAPPLHAVPASALAEKRVLLLTPYGFGRPGVDSFIRVHVDALAKGGIRRENILVEFLNLNRNTTPQGRARLRELLLAQYQGQPLDLIVTVQQPALDFVLGDLQSLAPHTPMLTVDASPANPASVGQHPMLLLPPPELTVRATLGQALQLFPDTERLIVAVGASETDLKIKNKIVGVVAEMGLRLAVDYTDALSFDDMAARVAAAPAHSIVLLAPMNRDRDGRLGTGLDNMLRVSQASRVPAFTMYSTGIGDGPIGGSVLHIEQLASAMAAHAIELLSGTRQPAPGITLLPNAPTSMYDWQ